LVAFAGEVRQCLLKRPDHGPLQPLRGERQRRLLISALRVLGNLIADHRFKLAGALKQRSQRGVELGA